MAVSQLGYIGIGVSNIAAWEEFVTEVLGMEISERAKDGTTYVRMDELHHRIALYPNGKDDVVHAGWATANRKELEATKAALRAEGVEYQQASADEIANRHVVDMVKVDLSGFPVEVFYGPHVVFERPFNSPLGTRGFKTGEVGLGHLAMFVNDMTKATRVLEEGLGFRVSDNFGGVDRFFHVNPREHAAVLGPHAQRGPKRMGHFMVELNDFNDVGFCLQRVEDRNIEIRQRLGRHSNDHMISFYMVNPSGFEIEYGWGGRLIDYSTWQVNRYDGGSIWRTKKPNPPVAQPPAAAR